MSIKPIDLKAIIPKAQQVSQSTNREINQAKTNLHGQILEQNVQIKDSLKKVNKKDEIYKGKLDENGTNKKKNKRENQNNSDSEKKSDDEPNKEGYSFLGRKIDIKI